jgi:NTE family protein
MSTKKALVLSGGSILGSFQAGAIAKVLESGFAPDAIYGTSVGSLNGAFLAERAGKAKRQGHGIDWKEIGNELVLTWQNRITSSSQLAVKRGIFKLVWSIIRKRFSGLVNTAPLQQLVRDLLNEDDLRESPVAFCACSVNVATGEAVYATKDFAEILDYVIASTAIPLEMPTSLIGDAAFVDGGIREVAPFRRAIEEGADEVVCIVCQPEKMQGASFNVGNFFKIVPRLMDIVTNELVNNDLQRFQKVNDWVDAYEQFKLRLLDKFQKYGLKQNETDTIAKELHTLFGSKYRHIEITIIRPQNEIVMDLLHFTSKEIRQAVEYGRDTAEKALEQKSFQKTAAPLSGIAATP